MPHFQFPTNYVYWQKIEDHDNIKKEILPVIREKEKSVPENPFTACNMTTNFNSKNQDMFLSEEIIHKLVWEPIENMINECEIAPSNYILKSYWFNTYDVGDFQEMHSHKSPPVISDGEMFYPTFSLVYILNDDNDKSSTIFIDHIHGYAPFCKPHISSTFDTSHVEDIREGTVMVFSSNLHHFVRAVKMAGRTTIAFNVYSSC